MQLVYTEESDSNLGPFTVTGKVVSPGGDIMYAIGSGRGRGKKDAKQVAAAALLEHLLESVPESEFLQPGKAKQRLQQARETHSASGKRPHLEGQEQQQLKRHAAMGQVGRKNLSSHHPIHQGHSFWLRRVLNKPMRTKAGGTSRCRAFWENCGAANLWDKAGE